MFICLLDFNYKQLLKFDRFFIVTFLISQCVWFMLSNNRVFSFQSPSQMLPKSRVRKLVFDYVSTD